MFQNTTGRQTDNTYGRPSDADQLELDLFHHHIDSNDLSNSQIQAIQESLPDEGQLLKDSVYQLNEPSFEENQQQL